MGPTEKEKIRDSVTYIEIQHLHNRQVHKWSAVTCNIRSDTADYIM